MVTVLPFHLIKRPEARIPLVYLNKIYKGSLTAVTVNYICNAALNERKILQQNYHETGNCAVIFKSITITNVSHQKREEQQRYQTSARDGGTPYFS